MSRPGWVDLPRGKILGDPRRRFGAKKFDAYAGLMYSRVTNGLASGFLFRNTVDPTAGLRFRF
jgi:hypothetical protein